MAALPITEGATYELNEPVTLYAQWSINSYTVTFDSQGGSAVANQNVNYNGLVTQPSSPARTGHTFGGWYTESSCVTAWNFSTNTITTARTLYAKWTINVYTVAFDSQGGSAIANQNINYNGLVTQPSNPTRTGYTFGGWYTENSCITSWNFSTNTITIARTLYAKWTLNVYTVTFESQGGTAVANQPVNHDGGTVKDHPLHFSRIILYTF